MGIFIDPYNYGFDYPVIADNAIPEGNVFFKQGKQVDVSEYDTRETRNGNRRTENEVLHSKADAYYEYRGARVNLDSSVAVGSVAYAYKAYPKVTVILAVRRQYIRSSNWWQTGTYLIPSLYLVTGTGYNATRGMTAWCNVTFTRRTNPVWPGGEQTLVWEGVNGVSYPSGYPISVSEIRNMLNNIHLELPVFIGVNDTTARVSDLCDIPNCGMFINDQRVAEGLGFDTKTYANVVVRSINPDFSFLLMENQYPDGYGLINYVQSQFYATVMLQHAYLDALSSVEHAWDNGLQNVTELVKFFVNLFVHHKVDVPKNWKDGWLSYRYVYTTSKLDQEDLASDILNSLNSVLKEGKRYVKVRGSYNTDIRGVNATCRVSVYIKNAIYDFLDSCRLAVERFGLVPDLYVLWDFTPYSFVIDWFLPIGNTLGALDDSKKFDPSNGIFLIGPITYSYEYEREIEGIRVHNYSRFVTNKVPIEAFYWFVEPSSTTVKTWGKRIIDSAALFT